MNIIHKVAMCGGNLTLPTKVPLIKPMNKQQTMVIRNAYSGDIPGLYISSEEIIALIPTIEPMDRSIFPVIRTKLWPIPTSRNIDIERKRFMILTDENTVWSIIPKVV